MENSKKQKRVMSNSDTPRTDVEISYGDDTDKGFEYVDPEFSRTLERELAAAKKELEDAREDLDDAKLRADLLEASNQSASNRLTASESSNRELREALELYRSAYTPDGHTAPHDCFSTGPRDGTLNDHLCPGCAAEKAYLAATQTTEPKG